LIRKRMRIKTDQFILENPWGERERRKAPALIFQIVKKKRMQRKNMREIQRR